MTIREIVFERDEYHCRVCVAFNGPQSSILMGPLELAHLKAKGMGGNPDGSRGGTDNQICCCRTHHQGPRSIHSGHLKPIFLTAEGAAGPMAFVACEKLPKAELGIAEDYFDLECLR